MSRTKLTEAQILALADRAADLLPDLADAIDALNKGTVTIEKPAKALKWFGLVAQQSAAAAVAIAKQQELLEDRETIRRLYEQRAAAEKDARK